MTAAAAAKSLQLCPTLCDPIDGSPPGSLVPGILQARTLEWLAISISYAWKWKWKWSHSVVSDSLWPHGLSQARPPCPSPTPGGYLKSYLLNAYRRKCVDYWPNLIQFSSAAQSCPTLCDPIDGSPPGSPVPGILQARILEWVAISFSNTLLTKVHTCKAIVFPIVMY